MFEKLKFEFQKEDNLIIEYYFKGEEEKYWRDKTRIIYGTDIKLIFFKDTKEFVAYSDVLADDYEYCAKNVDIPLLQAINQQCKELGWFE